jgi:hypothetical protein
MRAFFFFRKPLTVLAAAAAAWQLVRGCVAVAHQLLDLAAQRIQ